MQGGYSLEILLGHDLQTQGEVTAMKPDILLVEDNADEVDLAMRVLAKEMPNCRVARVSDGVEALDYLATEELKSLPKVILLDLKLPRLDGLEVLRVIKAEERTRNIPVVIMTSSQEQRDVIDCYALGANSYIVKPIDFREYFKVIANIATYWLSFNQPLPQQVWSLG